MSMLELFAMPYVLSAAVLVICRCTVGTKMLEPKVWVVMTMCALVLYPIGRWEVPIPVKDLPAALLCALPSAWFTRSLKRGSSGKYKRLCLSDLLYVSAYSCLLVTVVLSVALIAGMDEGLKLSLVSWHGIICVLFVMELVFVGWIISTIPVLELLFGVSKKSLGESLVEALNENLLH